MMNARSKNGEAAPEIVRFNNALISKTRALSMITGGVVAGIFGLDGVQGFLFYFLCAFMSSFAI